MLLDAGSGRVVWCLDYAPEDGRGMWWGATKLCASKTEEWKLVIFSFGISNV